MDVFTVAAELLGDLKLTSGQLGQLRALEYRLLLESLRPREDARRRRGAPAPTRAGRFPPPPEEEAAALRALVVEEILQMLTPDQRARLNLP